jgi:deoxyribonuclease V
MKIAIDVFYKENSAKIVAVVFEKWEDEFPQKIVIKEIEPIYPYIPGEFYKRELPCLVEILLDFDIDNIDVIIIDGYVYLDDASKPGLGAYLYEYLNKNIPVIGVAKTTFHLNIKSVKDVYRGKSQKPLYVTSIGIDLDDAANHIQNMYGEHRMPYLLKLVDTETKK